MRKNSILDDLVSVPWWINLVLGAVVYVLLKFVLPEFGTSNPLQTAMYGSITQLAGLIASLFVLTAFFSLIRDLDAGSLFQSQSKKFDPSTISWSEFEKLVGEAYKRQGYTVTGNMRVGADGGVDLVLRKGTEKTLVQCKHWKSSKVGVTIVRELYGVMTKEDADGGIVVCSGVFTSDAIEFVKGLPIQLVDGAGLKRLIVLPKTVRTPNIKKPLCPVCGGDMIMRRATKGKHVGKDFLGCRRFPKCRGTRKA